MICEDPDKPVFMTIIARRNLKANLLTTLLDCGIHLIKTHYARGTVITGYIKNTFGLTEEERYIVMICVSTSAKVNAFLQRIEIEDEYDFDQPDTGIIFTIPVDKVSF
jgi:hypothetical protein